METFAGGRYSKRKRAQVNYDNTFTQSDLDSDAEGSIKKAKATLDGDDDLTDDQDSEDEYESDYKETQLAKNKGRVSKKGKKLKMEVAASESATPDPPQFFRFLDLPAELRNIIYEYVLIDDFIFVYATIMRGQRCVASMRSDPTAETAILSVNKQIYFEARPVLYSNEIHFADLNALVYFTARVNPNSLYEIRTVGIRIVCNALEYWSTPVHLGSFVILAQMSKLSALKVDLYDPSSSWLDHRNPFALNLFRIALPFFYAVASRQGSRYAGIDMLDVNVEQLYWDEDVYNEDQAESDIKAELKRLLDNEHKNQHDERAQKQKRTAEQNRTARQKRTQKLIKKHRNSSKLGHRMWWSFC